MDQPRSRRGQLEYARVWKSAQRLTRKPVKFGAISGQMVATGVLDQHYKDRRQLVMALGEAMNAALRLNDCLFRTGGDEFAVAVPVRDESDALQIADRLQRAARRAGFPVSIGVAVVTAEEPDPRVAFARADAALYSVKRRGRDGTALAHPRQAVERVINTSVW